jgi:hypothetical protein
MTLVDTNVVIDVTSKPTEWLDWSLDKLTDARLRGSVFVNDIVFAELAARYVDQAKLEKHLCSSGSRYFECRARRCFVPGRPMPNIGRREASA